MENPKASPSFRSLPYASKQSLRPPKSPFPSISPAYVDYGSTPAIGSKGLPKPKDGYRSHQRTTSESFLVEEQPSWLDELLDEPATPVRRGGHRRASSDSFAYFDAAAAASSLDRFIQDEYKSRNSSTLSSWGSQGFDQYKDAQNNSFYQGPNSFGRKTNRAWESPPNTLTYPKGVPLARDNFRLQSSGSIGFSQEIDGIPPASFDKLDQDQSNSVNVDGSSEIRDSTYAKPSASDSDPKRNLHSVHGYENFNTLPSWKEMFKLYRQVHTEAGDCAEGSEVSSEIKFLDQQHLILTMENKALKQRLDTLAQEQLIKYLEQEVLEREIARLRALYQQQQMPTPPSSTLRRTNSRDLELQFANLGLKHREASSGQDHCEATK
ncbi:hypothetical protein C5167_012921 [Papaver somniferum]|uniref:BZIP domain-containing protein n=1 Tax=Papaver somniferum TaxID=3469 RepID=A0A4Y7J200_PAPSO|nr:hypothetical protein C5167_012921 [Papaver somniferum]